MKQVRRIWMPLLLGMVLVATLVGVATARPSARPQQQAWRVLTVPAHTCNPMTEDTDYNYYDWGLGCNGFSCPFVCPMDFPAAGEQAVGAINVKRVTAYVLDNDGTASDIDFYFRKIYPMGGDAVQVMAEASSTDSPSDPQEVMDTTVVSNPVYRSQAPYVWVVMNTSGHRLYGVYVHYTWY
jgi:hypothetical protein